MFIDILEFRIENETKIFRKNCFGNVVSDLWLKLYVKLLQKKKFLKFGLSWGKFWPLRTLGSNLHIFLDNFEFRVKNKPKMFRKNCLKMLSQKFTRRSSFVPNIRQRFEKFS